MKRLTVYILSLSILLLSNLPAAFGQTQKKIFKTKYTFIHYDDDKDMDEFVWRLGGGKFEFFSDVSLASSRIDRIVDKVMAILGMWTKAPRIDIFLYRGVLEANKAAFYDNKTKAIHISVENSSDGVFAHEVAHVVINQYFVTPPPSRTQEILTQYVDKYLWSDY